MAVLFRVQLVISVIENHRQKNSFIANDKAVTMMALEKMLFKEIFLQKDR